MYDARNVVVDQKHYIIILQEKTSKTKVLLFLKEKTSGAII